MANLIGTAPNQVPTNGSLGTMAFQDADNANLEKATVGNATVTDEFYIGDTHLGQKTIAGYVGPTIGIGETVTFTFSVPHNFCGGLVELDAVCRVNNVASASAAQITWSLYNDYSNLSDMNRFREDYRRMVTTDWTQAVDNPSQGKFIISYTNNHTNNLANFVYIFKLTGGTTKCELESVVVA